MSRASQQGGDVTASTVSRKSINSSVIKLLVIHREIQPGRITVVLVDEALGF